MASAPDTHPDSPSSGPSEAPDQLSPGNREDRGNEESPPDDAEADTATRRQ